jgi:phage tail sheath protein FI
MPEYLHPGVYVEETSYRGKPIEGVSTSTAGFVGRTRIGAPGRPTLVTSFMQFTREFGAAYSNPDATKGEMLGHALRGFFDNGGKRAYVVRVLGAGATNSATPTVLATAAAPPATPGLTRGVVLRLAKNTTVLAWAGAAASVTLKLNTLRGVVPGTRLRIFSRASSASAWAAVGTFAVSAVDRAASTATITPGGTASTDNLVTDHTFVLVEGPVAAPPPDGIGPFNTTAAENSTVAGPVFTARDKGVGGDDLAVNIVPVDRPAVNVTASNGTTTFTLATVANLYVGAIVEWHKLVGTTHTKGFDVVSAIDADLKTITIGTAPGLGGGTIFVRVLEINVDIYRGGTAVESFANLTWNRDSSVASFARYFAARINDADTGSRYVTVVDPAAAANAEDQPTTSDGQPVSLAGGGDGGDPGPADFIGTDGGPGSRTGIESLKERDDISMVAAPGVTDENVQGALITHSELMKYRVAVLDGLPNTPRTSDMETHRNNYDSSRAAYYGPWLETLDLASGASVLVPPTGHVMGIWARSDNERGVHKAPANEVVRSISDVELRFGDGEQDVVNPVGINLIREFTGRGIRVWGARTLSSDPEWKYLNVRRLFNFVGHSIDRGTQWVVFEPNNEQLWARVAQTIEAFLIGVWKTGALMGTTPKEAFFVRCDRTTMTQDDIDNGRLIVLIGLAPTKPAEFVIFRIGQFTASSTSS